MNRLEKAAAFGARMGKLAAEAASKPVDDAAEFEEMTKDAPPEFRENRKQMAKWIRQTRDKSK